MISINLKKKLLIGGSSAAVLATAIVGTSSIVNADAGNNVPQDLRAKIEKLQVDPNHPDLETSTDSYSKALLEKGVAQTQARNLDSQLKNIKEEKSKTEEALNSATQKESELQKQVSDLEAQLEQKQKEAESKKQAEEKTSTSTASGAKQSSETDTGANQSATESVAAGADASSGKRPYFGSDGLLVESATSRAQEVINLLLGIPGHSNGSWYHAQYGVDAKINALTVEEATYVIHRIEGAGFGQTGDGFAGYDTPASHKNFLNRQVNSRFGGDIWALLRSWGTYSYGGY